jgi:hypothetical protein
MILTLSVLMASNVAMAQAVPDERTAKSPMESLGDERYRIGEIIVNREAASFSLPGKVVHLVDALEYLAVSRQGRKEYESLLELDTTPSDFKLACILVGLDEEKSLKPEYQFDERKVEGQQVRIDLSWEADGEVVSINATSALKVGDNTFEDDSWVYVGSATGNYGKEFMADAGGTLIGFVHDPYSIIDHANGAGIGNYGLITGNEAVLPDIGTAIRVTVTVIAE